MQIIVRSPSGSTIARGRSGPLRCQVSCWVAEKSGQDPCPPQNRGRAADPLTMLFRLSRVSFWLAAAAVAALALLAPGGHEPLLAGVALAASAAGFGLWRFGAVAQRRFDSAPTAAPRPDPLTQAALLDAAAMLVRQADEAASFDAALHAVARVLRGELGARRVVVREVRSVDATHAQVAELIESQPGFKARSRPLRLDAWAARPRDSRPGGGGRTARRRCRARVGRRTRRGGDRVERHRRAGRTAGPGRAAPAGAAHALRRAPTVRVSPPALRLVGGSPPAATTEPPRPATRDHNASHLHGHVLVVEDTVVQPELTARMLQRLGCRVTPASGMLEGLNALCRTQFDLILVDIHVSGLGAAEGLKWLRRGGATGSASARDTPGDRGHRPGLAGRHATISGAGFR